MRTWHRFGELIAWHDGATWRWEWQRDTVYRGGQLLAAISSNPSGVVRHYTLDHLGTPRLLTDGLGQVASQHTYFPYGEEATNPFADNGKQDAEIHRFTGHERDLVDGGGVMDDLDYMHARYYSPNLGRFLSVDPGRRRGIQSPQAWNLYAYAANNPSRLYDPDGRAFKDSLKKLFSNARFRAIATFGASVIAEHAAKELPPGKGRGAALLGAAVLATDSAATSVAVSAGSFIAAFGTVETGVGPVAGTVVGVGFAGLAIADFVIATNYTYRAYHNIVNGTDPADTQSGTQTPDASTPQGDGATTPPGQASADETPKPTPGDDEDEEEEPRQDQDDRLHKQRM